MWKLIWKPAFSAACAAASAPPAPLPLTGLPVLGALTVWAACSAQTVPPAAPSTACKCSPGYTPPGPKKLVDVYQKPQPEQKEEAAPQGGKIVNDMEKCILCGLCARKCPQEAITVDRKESHTWVIDRSACVQCGACMDACLKFHALSFAPDDGAAGTETYTKPV